MRQNRAKVMASLILSLVVLSCGGTQTPKEKPAAAGFLPEHIAAIGWDRAPELRHFVGDSLYEYINGGAELYHMYDFMEVTVADYHKGESEIVADLYRFADADRAYGMFTTLRPEEPDTVPLGVEGFSFGPMLLFVKGDYLANFIGYDESTETIAAVRSIAEAVDRLLPGTAEKPAIFSLFPQEGSIKHTEKMFAESFLGRKYLADVYTVDCILDNDTLTLILTDDMSGEKFAQWSEETTGDRTSTMSAAGLPYDEGSAFIIVDGYYGHIVAGLKNGTLAGVIGYGPKQGEFLAGWLNSLP